MPPQNVNSWPGVMGENYSITSDVSLKELLFRFKSMGNLTSVSGFLTRALRYLHMEETVLMRKEAYEGYVNDCAKIEAEIRRLKELERSIQNQEVKRVRDRYGFNNKTYAKEIRSSDDGYISAISEAGERADRLFQAEFTSESVYCIELISKVARTSGFLEAARKAERPELILFSSIRTLSGLTSMWSGVKGYADRQCELPKP